MESDYARSSSPNRKRRTLGFEINTTPGKHSRFIVPKYDCKRKYKLDGDLVEVDDNPQAKRRRLNCSCWNCGGYGHSYRNCTWPVNRRMLARNQQQFSSDRSTRNITQRYFEVDNGHRFDHLKTDRIRRDSQKGMDLNRKLSSRYTYNMRLLGYPGGSSEETEVSRSGSALSANKAYCRPKVPINPLVSPPHDPEKPYDNTLTDVKHEDTPVLVGILPEDGCEFLPPLPEEISVPPPPPEDVPSPLSELDPTEKDCEISSLHLVECNQILPTLVELKKQKKSFEMDLDDKTSSDSFKDKDISPATNRVRQSVTNSRTPSPNLGRMKSFELGTPVLKSVSPYSKLPSSESFSRNICDVINFENLPDSTGTYNKMVGILSKVRSAIKSIHQNAEFNDFF